MSIANKIKNNLCNSTPDNSATLSLTYKEDKTLLNTSPVNLIAQKVRPEEIEEKIKGGNLEKMANKINENYIPICVKMIFSNDRAECNVKQFDKIDYLENYNHYFYQLVNVDVNNLKKPVKLNNQDLEKGKVEQKDVQNTELTDFIDDSIALKGEGAEKKLGAGLKRNVLTQTAIPRIYRQVAERRTDYYNYA